MKDQTRKLLTLLKWASLVAQRYRSVYAATCEVPSPRLSPILGLI